MRSITVDYVQLSVSPEWYNENLKQPIGTTWSPIQNYKVKLQFPRFALHDGHNLSSKMLMVASGDDANWVWDKIVNTDDFYNRFSPTMSRLDIAITIDADDEKFQTVGQFWDDVKSGKIDVTPSLKGSKKAISSEKTVETVYLGDMKKRSKKGIFRCYDKGHESGLQTNFLTRFELELRAKRSHNQYKQLQSKRASLPEIFRRFVKLPMLLDHEKNEWSRIPDDKPDYKITVQDEMIAKYHWMHTVAPAIGRLLAMSEYDNTDDAKLFYREMMSSYRQALIDLDKALGDSDKA